MTNRQPGTPSEDILIEERQDRQVGRPGGIPRRPGGGRLGKAGDPRWASTPTPTWTPRPVTPSSPMTSTPAPWRRRWGAPPPSSTSPSRRRATTPGCPWRSGSGSPRASAAIDWAFHQIIADLPPAYLPSLRAPSSTEGVASFKLFMAYPNAWMLDDGTIFRALQWTADSGGLIMLHCENGPAIEVLIQQALAAGQTAPRYHAATRPSIAEGRGNLAGGGPGGNRRGPGVRGAPVGVRSPERGGTGPPSGTAGLRRDLPPVPAALRRDAGLARLRGLQIRHLPTASAPVPSREAVARTGLGATCRWWPPTTRPSTTRDRRRWEGGDFTKIPNGMPGVEWRVSLLYHFGVLQNRISLNRWVEITSTNAAKMFGLYPQKGEIAPGSDADLVIFDPGREQTLSAGDPSDQLRLQPLRRLGAAGRPRDGSSGRRAGGGRWEIRGPGRHGPVHQAPPLRDNRHRPDYLTWGINR